MKIIKNLVIVLFVLLVISCKKSEITPPQMPPYLDPKREQWGLVINYTATWCYPCGSWGSAKLHELANTSPRVAAVTNHAYGDPMHNQLLFLLMHDDRRTGGGIPSFWIGDYRTTFNSVLEELLTRIPIAAIDMKAIKHGDSIKYAYQVKFFESAQGDFYVSIWLLESIIPGGPGTGDYEQEGNTNTNFTHDFVLREVKRETTYGNYVYGKKFVTNPSQNFVFEEINTLYVNPAWSRKLTLVCCIWKYDPTADPEAYNPRYKFVNAFKVDL